MSLMILLPIFCKNSTIFYIYKIDSFYIIVDICHDSCGRYYLVGKILKKFFGILDADYLAGVVNADEERSAMSVGE